MVQGAVLRSGFKEGLEAASGAFDLAVDINGDAGVDLQDPFQTALQHPHPFSLFPRLAHQVRRTKNRADHDQYNIIIKFSVLKLDEIVFVVNPATPVKVAKAAK